MADKHTFTDEELTGALKKHEKTAEELLQDKNKMATFLEKVKVWIKKAKKVPVIGALVGEIITMIELAADYVKGDYREIPFRTMVSIVAALAYALSPIDLIPDAIPFAGYLDDAAIIALILQLGVSAELNKYRKWKREQMNGRIKEAQKMLQSDFVKLVGEHALAGAFLTDEHQIKLLLTQKGLDDIPVECTAILVSVREQWLHDFGIEGSDSIVQFYSKVFEAEQLTWSCLGKRPFMLEYDCKTFDDDYVIVEDE